MRQIICKNGEIALCDDEDYPLLSRFKWYMGSELKNGRGYPCCFIYGKNNTRKQVFMHQLVMAGVYGADHIDNDGMNNQRHNFRLATHQENGWNSRKQATIRGKPCSSKYKGVIYAPLKGKPRWLALIKHVEPGQHKSTGKVIRLGYFYSEDEAGRAYNKKVVELRGDRAWLNPVPEINDEIATRDREDANDR